jgi:hypothetical protein
MTHVKIYFEEPFIVLMGSRRSSRCQKSFNKNSFFQFCRLIYLKLTVLAPLSLVLHLRRGY